MANKKKIATATTAVALAAALLLGGTFAWQSISQTALNEKEAVINPGGRLHDDFNGTNKDVYVENFAEDTIYARVRLDEYFEIVMNKGTGAETKTVVTEGAEKDKTDTYITHKFDDDNTTDTWWNWETGGSTIYMPTFNKNKDSLKADINGTYENDYVDYVEYTDGQEVIADTSDGNTAPTADALDLLNRIGVKVNYNVETAAELEKALANGGTVTLTDDITLENAVAVKENTVLNLGGHKITSKTDLYNEDNKVWSLISVDGATLTINGTGTVEAKEDDSFCVDVRNGGKVVINGGKFVGNISAVYVKEGEAAIYGGELRL